MDLTVSDLDLNVSANGGKRLVLFGKTGSGKSTIANMLVEGNLHHRPLMTPIGDGMRGTTRNCAEHKGRGWNVVDTVGFGEPPTGAIPNSDAEKVVTEFLQQVKGPYSHIVFVQKKGRCDGMDKIIWRTFLDIFKGGESNIVVVFTDATPKWLTEFYDDVQKEFSECKEFLTVDFPGVDDEDSELEEMYRDSREEALVLFEESLDGLFQNWGGPVNPEINGMSKIQLQEKSSGLLRLIVGLTKKYFKEQADVIIGIGVQAIRIIFTDLARFTKSKSTSLHGSSPGSSQGTPTGSPHGNP